MKLRWTTPALRDLENIGGDFAHANPDAAAKVIMRIFDQVDMLAAYPHLGRAGRVPETRELVVPGTPFIVPYRVRGDVVGELAVFHGARKWPDSFG